MECLANVVGISDGYWEIVGIGDEYCEIYNHHKKIWSWYQLGGGNCEFDDEGGELLLIVNIVE